jgi:hypothetical protein
MIAITPSLNASIRPVVTWLVAPICRRMRRSVRSEAGRDAVFWVC